MLNELFVVERGARAAGIKMIEGHPDIKDARRTPTLVVRLDGKNGLNLVRPVPPDLTIWTLRNGQHNSFPFVQLKPPLWAVADGDARRDEAIDETSDERRNALLSLACDVPFNAMAFDGWPGAGLLERLRKRRQQFASLEHTESAIMCMTIDRFLQECEAGNGAKLVRSIAEQIVKGLRESAHQVWIEVAAALLLGTFNKKRNKWECTGGLLFEADGCERSIVDFRTRVAVGEALRQAEIGSTSDTRRGRCALTASDDRPLLSGNFPQPNLPILGQTYLFAKNQVIRANDRYGRFASDAFPIGAETAIRLAAAIEALTTDEQIGVTWRSIPREASKKNDLLLAFVEQVPEVPVAAALADDAAEDDFSEESPKPDSSDNADPIATYEKRTQRLIDAVKGKVGADFRQTPVRLVLLRSLDPANRKIVYSGAPTVGELYDAATDWAEGERNVPPWLTLPVLRRGERKPRPMSPPHVAPLGMIALTKQIFLRNGQRPPGNKKEQVGLPAAEIFGLFLDTTGVRNGPTYQRLRRALRLVISRRASLVTSISHVQHTPESWDRREQSRKKLDAREALRTVTVLAVLLHKLGRKKGII